MNNEGQADAPDRHSVKSARLRTVPMGEPSRPSLVGREETYAWKSGLPLRRPYWLPIAD